MRIPGNMRPAMGFVVVLIAIFALNSSASAGSKEKVLYSFHGGTDGSTPAGGVVFDAAGNLYGTTQQGGGSSCKPISYCGTVFKLSLPAKKGGAWTESVLHVFAGFSGNGDGAVPEGGLVIDAAGNLYGTTAYGGSAGCVLVGVPGGCGTVFELRPPKTKDGVWTYKILYNFQSGKDGYFPWGDLTLDGAGNLYGATQFGGGFGTCDSPFYPFCGTVFEVRPPKFKSGKWKEKVLYSFKSGKDGANPNGGLVFDSMGVIYGTTYSGGGTSNCHADGVVGCGTAFQLTPSTIKVGTWKETLLHRFKGGGQDTNTPMAGFVWGGGGKLYGTTAGGQNSGGDDGAIYQLTARAEGHTQWNEVVLHRLSGRNGVSPMGGLSLDEAGQLIGTASVGGVHGGGTVFCLTPIQSGMWSSSVLHAFTGSPDGSYPTARTVLDKSGNVFGTTQQSGYTGGVCGNQGCGTVFMVAP